LRPNAYYFGSFAKKCRQVELLKFDLVQKMNLAECVDAYLAVGVLGF
jgi:hypothetical protein